MPGADPGSPVDLHHHCLPGVDDGPPTLEEAVAQCRAARAEGFGTVVATPHARHPQFHAGAAEAREAHGALVAALAREGVDLEVLLGHEVHWSAGIPGALAAGELLRLGGNGRWFLLELPDSHLPAPFERAVFEMQLAGAWPVLAHPERNADLAGDPGRLAAIRSRGVPVQVTAMALTGEFGRRARAAVEGWLRAGLVDLLATDAHGPVRRPPRIRAAIEAAARIAGEATARRIAVENPRRILRGEALP